jgi:hypothetical protein
MDHHDHHEAVDGPWAGGWLVALVAGLFAALLARSVGATGMTAAMAVGAVTFLVFGVLMGNGGVELTLDEGHGDDHGHGHH